MAHLGSNEAEEEEKHFKTIIAAYKSYERDSKDRLKKSEASLRSFPLEDQLLLRKFSFHSHLEALENCVKHNATVLNQVVEGCDSMFEEGNVVIKGDTDTDIRTSPLNVEKLQSTIKTIIRDWSSVCAKERSESYQPILNELERLFEGKDVSKVKVLVPGSGMGRLAWEIAHRGFDCQGNEFSVFMLLASNFVLNKCKGINSYHLYPWIHQFTNNLGSQLVTAPAYFPDVDTRDLPEGANFSMSAGDFLEVYGNEGSLNSFDCVASCYFIDCAHNILEFVRIIHKILKPGGKWINFGPLLYHFADIGREKSIEPPYDVLRSCIQEIGFEINSENTNCQSTYCQNANSMFQFTYNCVFFTCTKK